MFFGNSISREGINVTRFVGTYPARGENSTKMALTLEERPKRTYPFGGFDISLRSTYRQKIESKRL